MSQAEHVRLMRLEGEVQELRVSLTEARKEIVKLWEKISDFTRDRKGKAA